MTAITTALSGMLASAQSLNATASNLANQQSAGPVPQSSSSSGGGGSAAYEPVDTVEVSAGESGGVQASYRPRTPAYQLAYAPDSPDADANGVIAVPNVDPVRESVDEITSLHAFRLNAAAMKAGDQMEQTAVNLLA